MFRYTSKTAEGWDGVRGASLLLTVAPDHAAAAARVVDAWLAGLTGAPFVFDGRAIDGRCAGGAAFHQTPEGLWIHSAGQDGLESIEWYAQHVEGLLTKAGLPEDALHWHPAPHRKPARFSRD